MRNSKAMVFIVLILVIVGWMVIDYYHYAKPGLEAEKIKQLAQVELRKELPDILSCIRHGDINEIEVCSLEVLDVQTVREKTYLVFKLDYKNKGTEPAGLINDERYILGLRLVEKKGRGVALRQGMEFEVKYAGMYPADCGQYPEGVFFGFCKDPRVSKVLLQSAHDDMEVKVKNRVILAGVPSGKITVRPTFFDIKGREIYPYNEIKIALILDDQRELKKIMNMPAKCWVQDLKDIDYLTAVTVDAVWIFPDKQQEILQGQNRLKINELVNDGIPVIFIGATDTTNLVRMFQLQDNTKSMQLQSDTEAVYAARNSKGTAEVGVIAPGEEGNFSFLQESMELRFHLDTFRTGAKSSGININEVAKFVNDYTIVTQGVAIK